MTGKLLSAEPYVAVNWSNGIDMRTGRPRINPQARYDKTGGTWIGKPSSLGGHNWQPMAFNPATGLAYIPIVEMVGVYKSDPNFHPQPMTSNTGDDVAAIASVLTDRSKAKLLSVTKGALLAWNPVTQKAVWRAPNPGIWNGGVLTTAGNLVIQGDSEGHLNAYDAKTGAKLWSFDAQNPVLAAPRSPMRSTANNM
ncbi:MAG: PQQ-binding-like beta-propeller repeat protein [Rhizomicrobium sp.]